MRANGFTQSLACHGMAPKDAQNEAQNLVRFMAEAAAAQGHHALQWKRDDLVGQAGYIAHLT